MTKNENDLPRQDEELPIDDPEFDLTDYDVVPVGSVFTIDEDYKPLPSIYVTREIDDPSVGVHMRELLTQYPQGPFPFVSLIDDYTDELVPLDGSRDLTREELADLALMFGSARYREGMDTVDEELHELRVDCFRAAELFYLWAAHWGSVDAYTNLGYVYSYDRCEGQYLGLDENGNRVMEAGEAFPRDRRSFEVYKKAAEANHPEACYKLGDMYKNGTGCDPDAVKAVEMWTKAYELCKDSHAPVWWGSVALRLGSAAEEGMGCEQDFEAALKWFRQAETGLQIAVDHGASYYRKALSNARNGVLRCEQELSGAY